MKVLLVKPFNLSDHIQPSLGLGYLAAAIQGKHEVDILDCIKEGITPGKFGGIIRERRPDVVGVQCYTFDINNVREILSSVKKETPSVVTIVGGPHIYSEPFDSMNIFGKLADFCFSGEGEKGFPMFLDILATGGGEFHDIPGLVWRSTGGRVIANPPRYIDNLDELGLPAWNIIQPENYPESQHGAFYEKFPIAPIITTRGCPYSCTFCIAPILSGKKLRHHSVEYIVNQVKTLYHDHGIREFHIVDDNFTLDIEYAKSVLRAIIGLNLDISMATPNGVRMDRLDDDLLELMREAGIYIISIAVESGDDGILKSMKKSTNVGKIKLCVDRIRRHGIDIAGFFILGFPGETIQTIRRTIQFSLELDIIRANFFTYLPLPGTESYKKLVESGEIQSVDWKNFYFMSAPYTPTGVSREQLLMLKREAFRRFYLRPRILWKNIRGIKSFRHFTFLLKRFYHWIIMSPSISHQNHGTN